MRTTVQHAIEHGPNTLRKAVLHQGQAVRVHLKRAPGSWSTNPEDRPAHKPARQQAYQALLLAKAERIGEQALAWAHAAIKERDVRAYRLLQGMAQHRALPLSDRHPHRHRRANDPIRARARAWSEVGVESISNSAPSASSARTRLSGSG